LDRLACRPPLNFSDLDARRPQIGFTHPRRLRLSDAPGRHAAREAAPNRLKFLEFAVSAPGRA